MDEHICLSTYTDALHSATDFSRGLIAFPVELTTRATRVGLRSLALDFELDLRDAFYVVVDESRVCRLQPAQAHSVTAYVAHIAEECERQQFADDFKVSIRGDRVHLHVHCARLRLSSALAATLGFGTQPMLRDDKPYANPMAPTEHAPLAPVYVEAPGLVRGWHGCLLAVCAQLPFVCDRPLLLPCVENARLTHIRLRMCTPLYPNGAPIKPTHAHAVLHLSHDV